MALVQTLTLLLFIAGVASGVAWIIEVANQKRYCGYCSIGAVVASFIACSISGFVSILGVIALISALSAVVVRKRFRKTTLALLVLYTMCIMIAILHMVAPFNAATII